MSQVHHPSQAVLADYASGALPSGPSLVVAAHLDGCPGCRGDMQMFEQVGGALIEDLPEADLADDALALALARIERPAPKPPVPAPDKILHGVRLPRALARQGVGARRWLLPGIWVAPVRSQARDVWRTYLIRAPAGALLADHDHRGAEFTAVIQGGYSDRTGHYAAGDFAEAEDGVDHIPRVDADGPCLCLISAEGGMRARGVMRLIQPFIHV